MYCLDNSLGSLNTKTKAIGVLCPVATSYGKLCVASLEVLIGGLSRFLTISLAGNVS